MSAYPRWTPASRPGIIPLRPLEFGTILGRSFAALRHNPRVLFGFAVLVQSVFLILTTGALVALTIHFSGRLETVSPTSEDYNTVVIGTLALIGLLSLALSIPAIMLNVVVQGVVVSEVATGVLAEKQGLGQLWKRVRPAFWPLVRYTVLIIFGAVLVIGSIVALMVFGTPVNPGMVLLAMLLVLAATPVFLWIATRLILVPAVLVLEGAPVLGAIARSWRLIRGRFWVAFGVNVCISGLFGILSQIVALPAALLSSMLGAVIAPTGDSSQLTFGGVLSLVLSQALVLVVQAVSVVVLGTANSLVYLDCRMRREGLDLDLLAYVDNRDQGITDLPDPYRANIGRELARPPWPPAPPFPGYPHQQPPPPPGNPASASFLAPGSHPWSAPPNLPPPPGQTPYPPPPAPSQIPRVPPP
ncbi:MAG: glycerophosphoryl diester phosphodiesterase membrane domain-containing protein [Propioniciclava sp.]